MYEIEQAIADIGNKTKTKRCALRIYIMPKAEMVAPIDYSTATWSPVGVGTEDVSISNNMTKTQTTDIFCITTTEIEKVEKTVDFNATNIRAGSVLEAELLTAVVEENWDALSGYSVMIVRDYLVYKDDKTVVAMIYDNCTVSVPREGGSTSVTIDETLDLGGLTTFGTVTGDMLSPTFVPKTDTPDTRRLKKANTDEITP